MFFDNEFFGRMEEITSPIAWLMAYGKRNEALREQLKAEGLDGFKVQTLDSLWGDRVPQPNQMTEAMTLYWLQTVSYTHLRAHET